MIRLKSLSKKFVTWQKHPGFAGTLLSVFSRERIEKMAVENFSLEVAQGEIVGLLGPNGAGKTTLMKMFTGIIVPSSGDISVLGYKPWERDKNFRKRIALVMGQKSQLWWDIPAMDSFQLLQKIYEIPQERFQQRIKEMATTLDVQEQLQVHVRKLSLGERMKMELMASLLHDPDVIFLDEPTIGLDLISQEKIRQFVKDYQKRTNCAIILTSHYMADVQEMCRRLVLIFDGKKRFDGPIYNFGTIFGQDKQVSFRFSVAVPKDDAIFKGLDAKWDEEGTFVELRLADSALREISVNILKRFPVIEFHTEKMPIERIMKTLMKNPKLLRNQS